MKTLTAKELIETVVCQAVVYSKFNSAGFITWHCKLCDAVSDNQDFNGVRHAGYCAIRKIYNYRGHKKNK